MARAQKNSVLIEGVDFEDPLAHLDNMPPLLTHSGKGGACYDSHPILDLGGGRILGGSCHNPRTASADVYIGFDRGFSVLEYSPGKRMIQQVAFPIKDRGVPSQPERFRELVTWTAAQLADGKYVHCGCIGGHGRTGLFLSALVAVINNDKDAIKTVRKIYCEKAVESQAQVKFLMEHFGVNTAPSSDSHRSVNADGWMTSGGKGSPWPKSSGGAEYKKPPKAQGAAFSNALKVFNPVNAPSCIWGKII